MKMNKEQARLKKLEEIKKQEEIKKLEEFYIRMQIAVRKEEELIIQRAEEKQLLAKTKEETRRKLEEFFVRNLPNCLDILDDIEDCFKVSKDSRELILRVFSENYNS